MLPIPPPLQAQFEDHLRRSAVPKEDHGLLKRWLRYYLDFCEKYRFPARRKESLPEFLGKLREKGQSKAQQEQAVYAIGVFYRISDEMPPSQKPSMDLGPTTPRKTYYEDVKQGQFTRGFLQALGSSERFSSGPAMAATGATAERGTQGPGPAQARCSPGTDGHPDPSTHGWRR